MTSSVVNEEERLLKESFKLNLYESRAYLTLLQGNMNAKDISARAGIPLSRVYDTLRSLEAKGFVARIDHKYKAFDPDIALQSRIDQLHSIQEEEMTKRMVAKGALAAILKSSRIDFHGSEDVLVLRGINSIANHFQEVLRNSEDILLVVRKAVKVKEFFKKMLYSSQKEGRRRIRILIADQAAIEARDLEFLKSVGAEARYSNGILFDLMLANGNSVTLGVPVPEDIGRFQAMAVVISSKAFASSTRKALEESWSSARDAFFEKT